MSKRPHDDPSHWSNPNLDDYRPEDHYGDSEHYEKRYRRSEYPAAPTYVPPQILAIEKTTLGVCKDINKICEGCEVEDIVRHLSHISVPIAAEFGREDFFRNSCLASIYATLTEQPHKVLLLSSLVQISDAKNPVIGRFVLEFFHQKCLDLVTQLILEGSTDSEHEEGDRVTPPLNDTGPFNKLKLVLRFLATLTPIIQKESILSVFEQTIQTAVDLQNSYGDDRCPLAESLYYAALISVPYLVVFNKKDEEFKAQIREKVLNKAAEFSIIESDLTLMVAPFGDSPKHLIKLIYPAVLELADTDYEALDEIMIDFEALLRSHVDELRGDQEREVNVLPKISFPSVELFKRVASLEGPGKIDALWQHPRLVFDVFAKDGAFETMPRPELWIGLIFRDIVQDVLESLEYNKNVASKELLSLASFFKPGLFAPLNSSLRDLEITNDFNQSLGPDPEQQKEKKSTWAVEDIIVENALSLAFQLPRPQTKPIYYYNVLVFACQNAPAGIAPRFGKAMRYFFRNIASLDMELRLRFLDWMLLQLLNFKFKWKWQEWELLSDSLEKSMYCPSKTFLSNLVFREVRLALKETIHESFGDQRMAFEKYLNVSLLPDMALVNAYDALVFGRDVMTENTPSELLFTKTIEQPFLKYTEHPLLPYFDEANALVRLIHDQNGGPESLFWDLVSAVEEKIANDPNLATDQMKDRFLLNFLFQCMCYATLRSISHFETFVSKILHRVRKIMGLPVDVSQISELDPAFDYNEFYDPKNTVDVQTAISRASYVIGAVMRYWNDTPQNGFIILEILTKLGLISDNSVLDYLFEENRPLVLVLCNSLATEIFLSILDRADDQGLRVIIDKLTRLISGPIAQLGSKMPEKIEHPTLDDMASDLLGYELRWKHVTLLALYKSVLRRRSADFAKFRKDVFEAVDSIRHAATAAQLRSWVAT